MKAGAMTDRAQRTRTRRRTVASLVVALGLSLAVPTDAEERRIVAIGDVHGAYEELVEILHQAALVDRRGRWVGGDAILVQTGDFLDRGDDAIRVAELLIDLQEQAPSQGGEVVVLLGNHEVLNLLGDLRDVTATILRSFVDARSEVRRSFLCQELVKLERRRAELAGVASAPGRKLRGECLASHALGLVEYFAELGPDGRLGRWLRGLPAVARLGRTVFLHGGISPELAGDVETINLEVRRELGYYDQVRAWLRRQRLLLPTSDLRDQLAMVRALIAAPQHLEAASGAPDLGKMQRLQDGLLLRPDGPFWFRGYARWSEDEGRQQVARILRRLDADHLVVGHTPQSSYTIRSRFGGKVFLIDTGMLAPIYRGRPSALEIHQGHFTAIYPDERRQLLSPVIAGNLQGGS